MQELKKLRKAIKDWVEANNGDVCFIGSFVSFDKKKMEKNKEDIIGDDIIVGFGEKKVLKILTDEHRKMLKEEKDFINW
jgi:hypothetical protein